MKTVKPLCGDASSTKKHPTRLVELVAHLKELSLEKEEKGKMFSINFPFLQTKINAKCEIYRNVLNGVRIFQGGETL